MELSKDINIELIKHIEQVKVQHSKLLKQNGYEVTKENLKKVADYADEWVERIDRESRHEPIRLRNVGGVYQI